MKNKQKSAFLEMPTMTLFQEFDPTQINLVKAPHYFLDEDSLVWMKRNNVFYGIHTDRLQESDWIIHMFGKMDFAQFGEFVAAYLTACHKKGIKKLEIDTSELIEEFADIPKIWEDFKKI